MGQRGPAPLPRAIKRARGTLQPCRDNPREPEAPIVTDFTPPDHPGEIARTKYLQLAFTLSEIGVLKVTDLDVLSSYCETYQEVRELAVATTLIVALRGHGSAAVPEPARRRRLRRARGAGGVGDQGHRLPLRTVSLTRTGRHRASHRAHCPMPGSVTLQRTP